MPYGEHYTTTAKNIGAEIREAFGDNLNLRQIWAIVKLAKLARRSCRGNTAFNTAFSAAFPQAKFKQVTKTNTQSGRTYPGLEITANGVTSDGGNDDDE